MDSRDTPHKNFTAALVAIRNLVLRDLGEVFSGWQMAAMVAHDEIELVAIARKTTTFYRHFLPLRKNLISLLADTYRRYFKLALAHPRQVGRDPDKWAQVQLQPLFDASLECIRDWFILACDGAKPTGTIEYRAGQTVSLPVPLTTSTSPPPESWRAPSWLFRVSIVLVGVGPLKTKHVPEIEAEQKLGSAHTRLLLKGARRVFLWTLAAAFERVRNEETAAAGAIPIETVGGQKRGPNKRKGSEQREKLYAAIRKVLTRNPSLQGKKFCAELDKRHAPPLYDWIKLGQWRDGLTWKEAWNDPGLIDKIRRVRQEAMKSR